MDGIEHDFTSGERHISQFWGFSWDVFDHHRFSLSSLEFIELAV